MTFPSPLETLIPQRVRRLMGWRGEGPLSRREEEAIAAGVRELSDYFTKRTGDRPIDYLRDRAHLAAYVAYFLPVNLLKITRPLRELDRLPGGFMDGGETFSLLDLGCGPGTASAGLLNYLLNEAPPRAGGLHLRITAADRVKEGLVEAEAIIGGLWEASESRRRAQNLLSLDLDLRRGEMADFISAGEGHERYDLVVLSNALVEVVTADARRGIVEALFQKRLKPGGSLIVIEPALREASRSLLTLREAVVAGGRLTVYAPCLTGAPCGALENPKDWCHEADPWSPPAMIERLDGLTGLEKGRLNYAYLVLRGDGRTLGQTLHGAGERFRVVSDLRFMKGEKRLFLCGRQGRLEAGRLDRERSETNAPFDDLRRGDIIAVGGLAEKGSLFRLGREGRVEILFRGPSPEGSLGGC